MTTDILDALAGDSERRAIAAEQNRRDFPLMASYLKLLERFTPRAIWAEENGRHIGKKPCERS